MALTDKLTAIADAIRGKTGGTEGLTLDQMAMEIEGISGGGGSAEWNTICEGKIDEAVGAIVIEQLSSLNINELLIFGRVMLSASSKLRFEHNGQWVSGNYVNTSKDCGAWSTPYSVYHRKFQSGITTEISIGDEHITLYAENKPGSAGYPIKSFEIHVVTDGVTFTADNTHVNAYYR